MAPRQPARTCLGCRQRVVKTDLLRVVAVGTGDQLVLAPDLRGRMPGRGAYVHPTPECLDIALRRRAFVRALRITGPYDTEPLRAHVEHRSGSGAVAAPPGAAMTGRTGSPTEGAGS